MRPQPTGFTCQPSSASTLTLFGALLCAYRNNALPFAMSSPLQSFLPYHVACDLLEHPGESPLAREQRFEAVALFADVSGFYRAQRGPGIAG